MKTSISTKAYSPVYHETTRLLDRCLDLINQDSLYEGFSALLIGLRGMYASGDSEVLSEEFQQFCLAHPIYEVLKTEPTVAQSQSKPRGYAGDADLIDYFYRLRGCDMRTSYRDRELHNIAIDNSSGASVRWRAKHLSELFAERKAKKGEKISCLSVASGHIREISYLHNPQEIFERFIALDQDNTSNDEARRSHPHDFLHIIDKSISYIIKDGLKEQEFDFVYSAGLFDYLNEKLAAKLIQKLYANVSEGGILLVPNFAKGILERGYMDIFMDWKLIYRNETQMLELAETAGVPADKIRLYRDPMCNVIYMRMEK